MSEDIELARRALACLDLTDLSERCSFADVEALCADAQTAQGPVAAVCVWPRFAATAKEALKETRIKVATVANFPAGGGHLLHVLTEVEEALDGGAREIDVVMPYNAVMEGYFELATRILKEVKGLCKARPMKVILETGVLQDPERIRVASDLAIKAGADFLKTSTGKTEIGATPEAAKVMLEAIRASERKQKPGLKLSGGVRTLEDARLYMRMAEEAMGPDYIQPATFRIGASSLLDALLEAIGDAPMPERKKLAY